MSNLVRTTIMLPEELVDQVKLTARLKNMSMSAYIRESIKEKVEGKTKKGPKINLDELAGKYKLGINKLYEKRSELYDEE